MSQNEKQPGNVRRKDAYHHGDLRDALVDATRQLVIERGGENFTLADACRLAGVSTAAPYKHFEDKDEILEELIVQGFDALSQERQDILAQHPPGSLAGMIAMGHGYVAFARRQPAIFRLMFGQKRELMAEGRVQDHGRACFGGVIKDVATYCCVNGLNDDAARLALELWTFVHGAASLAIDDDYEKVAPGLDVDALITAVTPKLLVAKRP